jgi:uncharacterized membrane protein YhhN
MIPATGVCLFGLAYLLKGELHRDLGLRIVSKVAASLGFLAVGVLAMPDTRFGVLMVLGLALGVVGDIALLAKRGFLAGLVAFLLGHLHYVLAFAAVAPIATWATPLALVPIALALGALRWLWPHVGRMRAPVLAYIAVITAMVIGALAVWRGDAIAHPTRMLAGTLLFFASDFAVAREKFVVSSIGNRIVGLPLYYAGQLLIAWSIS